MNHLHARYHTWSHITTFLSIATLSVAAQDGMPLLIAVPVLVWSWLRFRERLDAAIPQGVVNALLLAALSLFILDLSSHGIDQVISAVGRFVVALTLIKLVERRTARDQGQLLTLGLMMAIGAALTSVTFETGLMFVLYTPCAVWTLVLFQLWAGGVADAAARNPRYGKRHIGAIAPVKVVLSGSLIRGAHRLTFAAIVSILAVTVAIFVTMPRQIGEGILGRWEEPKQFESGFKDHVQLGATGSITESSNVVLEAEVIVNAATGLHSSGEQRYLLRGAILDEYNAKNGTWHRSASHRGYRRDPDRARIIVPQHTREDRNLEQVLRPLTTSERPVVNTRTLPLMELRIFLRNHNADQLLSLWCPIKFNVPEDMDVQVSSIDGAAVLNDYAGNINYTVECDPVFVSRTFWQYWPVAWTDAQMDFFFLSPIRDVALEVLAARSLIAPDLETLHEVVNEAREIRHVNGRMRFPELRDRPKPAWPSPPDNARQLAEAFQAYLQTNCTYTLDMLPPTGDEDPIEMFLLRTKQGHCEYFASAMAAMCRSVGLESRLVTGYAATEYDVAKSRYIVRESHAHAWVEVQVEPGVWVTYDPSPQEQLAAIHRPEGGVFAFFRRTIDRLEGLWATRIVSFSQDTQAQMIERTEASDGPLGLFKWLRARVTLAQEKPQPEGAGAYVMRVVMNFMALLTLLFSLGLLLRAIVITVQRRLGGNWQGRRQRRVIDAPAFYRKMMTMLTRAGLAKPEHIPAGRHAQWVVHEAPAAAPAVNALTALYHEARFGGRAMTATDMRHAMLHLEELRQVLRTQEYRKSEKS